MPRVDLLSKILLATSPIEDFRLSRKAIRCTPATLEH